MRYKVKWASYKEITWEPTENLKNTGKKVQEYYKKASLAIKSEKPKTGSLAKGD